MRADLRESLAAIGKDFHARGWMAGTAGNLSAREPDGAIWITASGRAKGRLTPTDFISLDGTGAPRPATPALRPSAETALHLAVYRLFPDARACLHIHSVASCLSARAAITDLRLPPLEMLKAFDLWMDQPEVDLPVFPNHLDVGRIATELEARFRQAPPALSAFMIQNHGVTVWGTSPDEAYHRVEALEFLLEYLVRSR